MNRRRRVMAVASVCSVTGASAGLLVRPGRERPSLESRDAGKVRLRDDLPPLLRGHLDLDRDGWVPRMDTHVMWSRPYMRRGPLPPLPSRMRSVSRVGESFVNDIEMVWYGRPVLRVVDALVEDRPQADPWRGDRSRCEPVPVIGSLLRAVRLPRGKPGRCRTSRRRRDPIDGAPRYRSRRGHRSLRRWSPQPFSASRHKQVGQAQDLVARRLLEVVAERGDRGSSAHRGHLGRRASAVTVLRPRWVRRMLKQSLGSAK